MDYLNHPLEYHRMKDAARTRAVELREQAIGEFWNGAFDATHRALRSSRRLAASFSRHSRLRSQPEA